MQIPQMRHEALRRAIPFRCLVFPFDDRQQAGRQFLAQFDAPLIEGVDIPDRRLDEDAMLIERDKPAERRGIEFPVGDGDRRAVAGKDAMRRQSFGFKRYASKPRLIPRLMHFYPRPSSRGRG